VSVKVTVPVGENGPLYLSCTVAVKVTVWVETEGFRLETLTVVVAVWWTVWVKVPELG
jgi:hypothetical protein